MKKIFATLIVLVVGIGMAEAQPYFRNRGQGTSTPRQRYEQRYYRDGNYSHSVVPYKGFLELGYSFGIGDNRSDRLDILTTHGLQVGNSTFIGVGTGLSVAFNADENYPYDSYSDLHTTGVSIPLYVDFRFGQTEPYRSFIQPFLDVKVGAQFRISDDTFALYDGFVDGNRSFYLSPSVGIRIPAGYKNAVNLAVTYNLTTYRICGWDHPDWEGDVKGLSSIGVKISYEW